MVASSVVKTTQLLEGGDDSLAICVTDHSVSSQESSDSRRFRSRYSLRSSSSKVRDQSVEAVRISEYALWEMKAVVYKLQRVGS